MSIGSSSGPLGGVVPGALIRAQVLGNLDTGAVVLVKGKPMRLAPGTHLSEGQEVQGKLGSRLGRLEFQLEKGALVKNSASQVSASAVCIVMLKIAHLKQPQKVCKRRTF